MINYRMHFLRCGRVSPEPEMRYLGQSNPPLCFEGSEELEHLREEFDYPRVQMVFASPLQRCLQTVDILYPNLYTETLEGLVDMGLGRFEGSTFDQLRDDPAFAAWLQNSAENPPPGGEDTAAFTQRIVLATSEIFSRMMEEGLTDVAVVTHGGVMMSLLAGIGLPKRPLRDWAVANGAGYTLLFTPQLWMRDRCAEIFAPLPSPLRRADDDFWESGL